jgi:hypothetical protein
VLGHHVQTSGAAVHRVGLFGEREKHVIICLFH